MPRKILTVLTKNETGKFEEFLKWWKLSSSEYFHLKREYTEEKKR